MTKEEAIKAHLRQAIDMQTDFVKNEFRYPNSMVIYNANKPDLRRSLQAVCRGCGL